MINKKHEYLKVKDSGDEKVITAEIYFTPFLVFIPLLVGVLLINDWYVNDFMLNEFNRVSELVIGLIIISGNILFDIPFIKSLIKYYRQKS